MNDSITKRRLRRNKKPIYSGNPKNFGFERSALDFDSFKDIEAETVFIQPVLNVDGRGVDLHRSIVYLGVAIDTNGDKYDFHKLHPFEFHFKQQVLRHYEEKGSKELQEILEDEEADNRYWEAKAMEMRTDGKI